MSTSPLGWTSVPLHELVDILDSQRVPVNSDERAFRITGKPTNQLIPYYGATGQVGWIDEALFDEELILLGEDGVPFFDLFKRKAYIVRGKVWVNNHAHVLRARSERIDARYLERYLNQFDFVGSVTGSTRLKLTKAAMSEIPVLVAPRSEQQRIADKLDTVLARVDACRDRLARVAPLLKRFRRSVLALAFSGKLAIDHSSPSVFATQPLAELASLRLGKMLDKQKNTGNSVPYLGNINVRWFGFQLDALKLISVEAHERDEFRIMNGDVLICEGGEPGRSAVWAAGPTDIVYQKALHRVRPHPEKLLPMWLAMYMRHCCDEGLLDSFFTGSTIKHLTGVALAKLAVPLPTLEQQTEIVRRVETLFAFADRLEARLTQAQTAVDRLTPSLLAKAFRGELVPQDPADEPAAELLRRLHADVAHNAGAVPVRRRANKRAGAPIA